MEAIVFACNQAFGVSTCQCVQHSDGGCDPSSVTEGAIGESQEKPVEEEAGTDVGSSEPPLHRAMLSDEYISEVDVDGKQETMRETITTDLEIKFITDVEVRSHNRTGNLKMGRYLQSSRRHMYP